MYITVNSAVFAYSSHMYTLCVPDTHTPTKTEPFSYRRRSKVPTRAVDSQQEGEGGEMDAKRLADC